MAKFAQETLGLGGDGLARNGRRRRSEPKGLASAPS
eukprot:COSAG02_NODE_55483_length_290_cov_0.921466_1_plen_35_part_01